MAGRPRAENPKALYYNLRIRRDHMALIKRDAKRRGVTVADVLRDLLTPGLDALAAAEGRAEAEAQERAS